MRFGSLLVLGLVAARASAHIAPVLPSTCAFEPASVEMPASSLVAPLAPAGTGDTFGILYDPSAGTAQFDLRGVAPRPFVVGPDNGTLALSPLVVAVLRTDGELTATADVTFTLDAASATVPVPLTTGLVRAGDALVEGARLGVDGRFTWIGVVDPSPLGSPLAGGPLVIRLSGQATPAPDTDQFRRGTAATLLSASLKAKLLKLKLVLTPSATDAPDFPGHAALLRISGGGATVTSLVLPALAARNRKTFAGQSADGTANLTLRKERRKGEVVYLLTLKVKQPSMPPASAGAVPVTITSDLGGLLSRTTVNFRSKRAGTVLHFP